jgi:hypothetical protein
MNDRISEAQKDARENYDAEADYKAEASRKQPKWKLGTPKPKKAPKRGYKWVQNLLTQKWIQIPTDTPYCCDPSMERYWSM